LGLLRWLQGDFSSARTGERPRAKAERGEPPVGDFRGSYGFGRRAHRPDPAAHYVFDNNVNPRRSRQDKG
jgi:hypothetical protein